MVDVVSIIVSVISVVGAGVCALLTGWWAYHSDKNKRVSEAEKLVTKYRDPLLLAAKDLQSRCFNMIEDGFLAYWRGSDAQKDLLVLYTAFLIGQYFSWVYILRRQAQFLCFCSDKDNEKLKRTLDEIQTIFSTDNYRRYEQAHKPFILCRGQQMAIGEIMTVRDGQDKDTGEHFCMGYAEFTQKWMHDDVFHGWFRSIEADIIANAEKFHHGAMIPDHRLRRLQHWLLDLIDILDNKRMYVGGSHLGPCRAAPNCGCSRCRAPPVEDPRRKNEV